MCVVFGYFLVWSTPSPLITVLRFAWRNRGWRVGGGGGGEEGWDPGVTVGEYIMKHLHIIPLDCTADVQVCIVRPSLRAAE